MKCSSCDADTRVLETRQRGEHFFTRRHECENGHRFTTVQVLETAYLHSRSYFDLAIERAARGVAKRRALHARTQAINAMLFEGHKWSVIQATLGVSESAVARRARGMKPRLAESR